MPRSEYYEPALLPGEKEQPQIIIDAVELYDLLVRAEMMMTKVDRIRYWNRAVTQIQDVIKEFMLAYDFEEDRRIHLKRLCANMAVFMWTVRLIGGRNIINVRDARSGETPDKIKVRIMESPARLDEGVARRDQRGRGERAGQPPGRASVGRCACVHWSAIYQP